MKHYGARTALIVVAAMALSVACGARNGELTGTVFVVTRGGENVKLGLVPVNVFPEDVLRAQIDRKQANASAELTTLRQGLKDAQASAEAAWQEVARLKAADHMTDADYNLNPADPHFGELIPHPAVDAAKLVAQAADVKVAELRERGRSLMSWQFYTDGIAPPSVTTKTDADGKFAVQVPRSGKMGLAARASRTAGTAQEEYYWLVWVTLDGKPTGQVMLSNDNLWGESSTQAVVNPDLREFAEPPPLSPREQLAKLTTAELAAVNAAVRAGGGQDKVNEALRAARAKEAQSKGGGGK